MNNEKIFLTSALLAGVLSTALPVYAQDVATPGDINIDADTPESKAKIAGEDAMNRLIALSLLHYIEQDASSEMMIENQEKCRIILNGIDRELLAKCPEEFRKIVNEVIDRLNEIVKDPKKSAEFEVIMNQHMVRLDECYTGVTGNSLPQFMKSVDCWAKEHMDSKEKEAIHDGEDGADQKVIVLVVQKLRTLLKAQKEPFLPKPKEEDTDPSEEDADDGCFD